MKLSVKRSSFFKRLKHKVAPLVLAGGIAFGGGTRAASPAARPVGPKPVPVSSRGVKPMVGTIYMPPFQRQSEFSKTNYASEVRSAMKEYKEMGAPKTNASSSLREVGKVVARKGAYSLVSPKAVETGKSLSVRLPQNPISAAKIDAELMRMNSPLAGKGDFVLRIAKAYNVDPAFFLAVARKESQGGTKGLARKTKNMCNVRWTQKSNYPQLNEFNVYPSWEKGVVGFFYQISRGNYYLRAGNYRVDGIIRKYAPSNENNTEKYIRDVEDYMHKLGRG